MTTQLDRLYELLPKYYRQRDLEQDTKGVLLALLRVITEQVNVVEADIAQLYENWFIETCQDWVVPYIGDLVGYVPIHDGGEPGDVTTVEGQQRNKILIPRREVANTIRYRRRKGTLALLDLLAQDVAGWPARVVEFYRYLSKTESLNPLQLGRGRTVDLRDGDDLHLLGTPFDRLSHSVDVRRAISHHTTGLYNIPSIGVFVWRLKVYPVSKTPAYCMEQVGPHFFTFSVLGNDSPLYTHFVPEEVPTQIAGPLNLPLPIGRRAFQEHKSDYYGEGKSLQIWTGVHRRSRGSGQAKPLPQVVKLERIIVADLSNWHYHPRDDQVAVDPVLGRIAFPPDHLPEGVWVSYYYGSSDDIGGGKYNRPISQPVDAKLYQVGEHEQLKTIQQALNQWKLDKQQDAKPGSSKDAKKRNTEEQASKLPHAVIEITDSGVYTEPLNISLEAKESLQIRAANGTRPVIRLLDWQTNLPDSLNASGESGSRLTLDGLLITGRSVQVEGNMAEVCIRHCTLVPGWELHGDCRPRRPTEPSLEVFNMSTYITIEHSILGLIEVNQEEALMDPLSIRISDSILDASSPERIALRGIDCPVAPVVLTMTRCTVFGEVQVHAIDLAENSIFYGLVKVARRQEGCMRFCYVTPGSRTPRCYNCQPDLVVQAVDEDPNVTDIDTAKQSERDHVQPLFKSVRYGTPTYCQLADACADEIKGGADDESEMGVFHDLFQPQRAANLRARLDEFTPAEMDAGIIYAS